MKEHAERNNIWDRSQVGTCSGVLGTVDQLIIDNAIMREVRNQQRNLCSFHLFILIKKNITRSTSITT